eukprot:TRINITY_DN1072_c0_g1_i6.p2 TRINITY_DN1072_c0_g1~~TRINITY_DN1072_c0_g1_i6.p2  ORF type:complete len:113 (+),score=30.52 TRINITY_DN1072_c0_g1_i6:1065-1403(+)
MVSNLEESCAVYSCVIENPEIIGKNGDINHMRHYLGKPTLMEKDFIYWIRDVTPHEALPLKLSASSSSSSPQYRQFLRLVTSEVSIWFKDHSTSNELGIEPCATIIYGNKFQ